MHQIYEVPNLSIKKQYISVSFLQRVLRQEDSIIINYGTEPEEYCIRQINLNFSIHSVNQAINNTHLTYWDMVVMDAIYTIMKNINNIMTVDMIAQVISGDLHQKITTKRRTAIEQTIYKLKSIKCHISQGEVPNKIKDAKYDGYLLSIEKVKARYKSNGTEKDAYMISEIPILYQHAESGHKIIAIPADYLDLQTNINNTDEVVMIKRYVINRVMQIVDEKKRFNSDRLSFYWEEHTGKESKSKGLFAELGYCPDDSNYWKKVKSRINKTVIASLERLKILAVIKAYTPYREDGTNNPASPIKGYIISKPTN